MNQHENRIEETLRMSDHIQRVSPSDDLMMRLKAIPSGIKQGYDMVPKKLIWASAASIAILIMVNFYSVRQYKKSKIDPAQTETVSDSYFSYLKTL